MSEETCTWTSGNEPCESCPRRISALYMCKLLQDEAKQLACTPFERWYAENDAETVKQLCRKAFIAGMQQAASTAREANRLGLSSGYVNRELRSQIIELEKQS